MKPVPVMKQRVLDLIKLTESNWVTSPMAWGYIVSLVCVKKEQPQANISLCLRVISITLSLPQGTICNSLCLRHLH